MFYRYGVKMYCNVLCYILVYSWLFVHVIHGRWH
jgi:hypothetical protein